MPDAAPVNPVLQIVAAGTMGYEACWRLQRQLHARVVASAPAAREAYLILVEHPPVLTLGKHAERGYLLDPRDVEVVATDRGGEVTAHEPGQLVAYPIVRLADLNAGAGLGPRAYVARLEAAVIRVLASYGVAGNVDAANPGVWVGSDKVCAIGVRVAQRATLHGLAFNVVNDLTLFSRIVPCGLIGRGVTSLSRLLGASVAVDAVAPRLCAELACGLGVPLGAIKLAADLQSPAATP